MTKLNRISYEVAGRFLFRDLSLSLSHRKYGLVGPNGVGKSTLAQIMAGLIEPSDGQLQNHWKTVYFPQNEPRPDHSVQEFLSQIWSTPHDFAELLLQLIDGIPEDLKLPDLSGGEWMRVRLAKALSQSPDFLILDEPTNNLDLEGQELVLRILKQLEIAVLVISHDRILLETVDEILELSNQGLSKYGGNFSFYWNQRQAERDSQLEDLQQKKRESRLKHQAKVEKLAQQTKRMQAGARAAEKGGMPKILLGARKRNAQKSLAKIQVREDHEVRSAIQSEKEAWQSLKSDPFQRFDFVGETPPQSKIHFSAEKLNFQYENAKAPLWNHPLTFFIKGSERWLIQGPNGSGKSTLIQLLLGRLPARAGLITGHLGRPSTSVAYLDQQYGDLKPELSLIDNLSGESRFSPSELRNELAFFNFRGDQALQKVGSFSGGELLKASLCKAHLGPKLPEILILDEPTNNLDFSCLELLEKALRHFQGAVILISHDPRFAESVGIGHALVLK